MMTVLPSSSKVVDTNPYHPMVIKKLIPKSDEELLAALDWGLYFAAPDYFGTNGVEQERMEDFLCCQSHVFSAFGFNEVRQFRKSDESLRLLEPMYKMHWKGRPPFYNREYEVLMRQNSKGPWSIMAASMRDRYPETGDLTIHLLGEDGSELSMAREKFVSGVAAWLAPSSKPQSDLLALNTLWAPPEIASNQIQAVLFSRTLLKEIHEGNIELRSLHWRQLEELVAELLRMQGFEVNLGPGSHDGGRDVVATGEFFPGHKLVMAVQVKQREVVNIGELAETLYRNRDYPLIMVATSGRFAAGVLQEKNQAHNALRLILEDGPSMRRRIGMHLNS